MDDAEYLSYDALGLAELVKAGDVSATELLALARARAEAVNPRINAIVREMRPRGRCTRPRFADRAVRLGPVPAQGSRSGLRGPAHQLGLRARAALPAAEHATVVQRWLDAGLVIFGKTNCPEFGAKGVTEPDLFGPARNPWALGRTPAAPREGRRPRSPPGSFRPREPMTAAVRSGSRRALTKIVDDVVDQNLGWVPYTQLANLTGRPAISLPLH
jgi:Asp-tRNA(Asn)/Glu-tRNA(Gln) amidotransferase A subunit family amidase